MWKRVIIDVFCVSAVWWWIFLYASPCVAGTIPWTQSTQINHESVLSLINESRVDGGMGELVVDPILSGIAQSKVEDMIQRQYLAHENPEGERIFVQMHAVGYKYRAAGENIATLFRDAYVQHEAWMNSETHRKNIMDERFNKIGIGIAIGDYGKYKNVTYVVTIFAAQPEQE